MYTTPPTCLFPAGESGVGKSTFIHNLVSGFKVVQPGSVGREGATTMQQFKANRNSLLTMLAPLDAPDTNQRLHITVQVSAVLQYWSSRAEFEVSVLEF
jgi:ABC-type thiamine transport system ATPase subunit